MPAPVSVLTLVRGRALPFERLVEGLCRQNVLPDRLVVAFMQDNPPALPPTPFPVSLVQVPGEPMPLAAARNRAAEAGGDGLLIFLDVDCIPSPELVRALTSAAEAHRGLLLGDVLYLPQGGADHDRSPARLDRLGERHPARPVLASGEIRPEPDHGALWGLCFALPASLWHRAGGMDERYAGYGAEETDFAARLARLGTDVHWVADARAWHQYHPVHVPPLQHFDHIVRNARIFRETWGRWCMEYWLGQFRDRGLVDWTDTELRVRRRPTEAECAAALASAEKRFS
ncbi:galactosyltransferase-related protein [Acetobacteraceae bacterium KSS8]|uniref:Galactosyltransferase-related protein n=1 Tax=Endosaccharibacter trunci TaxID=2812733 RepID=A0ABT1W9M2_9PROT|nr:galactosyltransferase-related protein [Acetobacteraceae bacterium KSS8]